MTRIEDKRLELHEILVDILGSRNVYYQPPESLKMKYPAIVYNRDDIQNTFSDNNVYMQQYRYSLIVIDEDPDSEIVEKISKMKTARYDRHFTKDNLNHDAFKIFY